MKPDKPLLAPPPGLDVNALDQFTNEGAPAPADPRLQVIDFPRPRDWRAELARFSKPGR
jgi:hypothetical protein